jgi:hypothetical protein
MRKLDMRAGCVAAVLVACSGYLAAATAQAATVPSIAPYTPQVLARDGFGDRQNSYAWAMAWFKGKLYVGTARDEWCVENATTQFYFPFANFYKTEPFLGVHCAPNEYNLDLRAEIWQYTPQTGSWLMVYRAPANIPNPVARGKFLSEDIAYRGMTVMRDRHGREALFVSGVTSDEYIPAIAQRHPPRLLRSYDGVHFHNISTPLIVKFSGPFPDRRAMGFRGLQVWRNHLYVLASAALTGDGAVFEVDTPFANTSRFTRVSPLALHVFELQTFDNNLYVGTGSYTTGYGVYETGSSHAPYRFKPIVTDGAGMGGIMVSVVSMHPFKGHLYVAAVSWYSWNHGLPGTEMIRIGHRAQWELVAGSPRRGPDGQMRYPISGLGPGFGNFFNSHIWRMTDQNGALYAGTLDWSWLLQDSQQWAPEWSGVINGVLNHEYGFDLWATCDGVNWFPVTRTAFNQDPKFNFGDRGLVNGQRGFYIGSANHADGTWIFHYAHSVCPSRSTARTARTAQAPSQLLTDIQRRGTVLSWSRSAGAVRYRVQRAAYVDLPFGLQPPPTIPGTSFPSEDALPQPVASGTPGSIQVQAPVLGSFTTLGTTTGSFFVDRTARPGVRYVYRTLAEAASGAASVSSNWQVVPDPRPAPTFAQLAQADHGSDATAAIASVQGNRRSELALLARLSRTAPDDQARELAYRLERRVRYENVAGGP